MSTKFIGKDGYQEIESLPFTRRKPQELNTAQKTVRFIKRAAALAAKKFKIKSTRKVTVKRNVTKPVAKRQNKPAVQPKPVMQTSSKRAEICYFDRRYSAARQGISFNDTDNPTLKLVTATRYKMTENTLTPHLFQKQVCIRQSRRKLCLHLLPALLPL